MEKTKKKIATIALILTLTITATLLALPIATAHDPPLDIPSWVYVSVYNDPIGVGQQQLIVFWCNYIPPTAYGAFGDRWTFTVEVTKPDNSKQTLGPITSDPVGGGWTHYTPDQVGTYTVVAIMEDHLITGEPIDPYRGIRRDQYLGDTFLGSTSDPVSFTAQQESIEAWPEAPLPTEYWTRPINTANREWGQLAANWLDGAAQDVGPTSLFGYGLAPESAHIMWATPMWTGGIMDARFDRIGYETSHYDGLGFDPPIIIDGKIFYNVRSKPKYGWICRDLYTGEQLFFHNTTGPINFDLRSDSSGALLEGWLEFGQILNYQSPNQHGGYPYLIGRGPSGDTDTWTIFDAVTGNRICDMINVPSGTTVYGKEGSILKYRINDGRLLCWNSTYAIEYTTGLEDPENNLPIRNFFWCWRPILNYTFDGDYGYALNVSIPDVQGSIREAREGLYVIGGTSGNNQEDEPLELGNLWALSLEKGHEGELLWNITYTPPHNPMPSWVGYIERYAGTSGPIVDPEDGVFLMSEKLNRQWYGYDLETGELLWGPTEPEAQMNYYGLSNNIYQGKLLSHGYGGKLVAYNVKTGEIEWTYEATNVGFESPYGNYPLSDAVMADGKIYMYSSEHSPTQPLWRGPNLRCIDAETGDEIWKILHWGSVRLADGFLVGLNYYDGQIYCYGKGPSATTVTASPAIIADGDSVLIKGTVMDQSPGTKQLEIASRFPNGVPAIADDDMQAWMEYLYARQAMPLDAVGVEVVLETLDPNGNYFEIDKVTSDASGMFKLMWEPPVEGEYTIVASFAGSESYWGSTSETAIGVTEAPSPGIEPTTEPPTTAPPTTEPPTTEPPTTEPPTTEPPPTGEAPLITTETAIAISVAIIAVIGIGAYWAFRIRQIK